MYNKPLIGEAGVAAKANTIKKIPSTPPQKNSHTSFIDPSTHPKPSIHRATPEKTNPSLNHIASA